MVIKEKIFFRVNEALKNENEFDSKTDIYCTQFDRRINQTTVDKMTEIQQREASSCENFSYTCFIGRGNNSQLSFS